jgi:sugar phosphate isomerase/epimerase
MNDLADIPRIPRGAMFPVKVGTTSYILPSEIVPNIEFLAPRVEDVELVLFESEGHSNLPSGHTIERLLEFKIYHHLSYTVHLPIDIRLGSIDEVQRRSSVRKCLRVIELTRPLDPFAYIVHFDLGKEGSRTLYEIEDHKEGLRRSVCDILSRGIHPQILCVETLDYPIEHVSDIVSLHGLSVCIDIGHLLHYGHSVEQCFEIYLRQCRVVHLHGIIQGRDHRHIGTVDEDLLRRILHWLGSPPIMERVLTIEVFDVMDLKKSFDILRRIVQWDPSHLL